jgi:hypothetical protein
METSISAPLLNRIKSWELVGLGMSGWVTLYSVAIIYWGSSSFVVGNTQGGSFAAVMSLAGVEVKRRQKGSMDLRQWAACITTEELHVALTKTLQEKELLLEALHPSEAQMGFGLRAVKAGRTFLFETGRWKESVIDLLHAKTTEENRNKSNADFAVIVGAGTPDEDTKIFTKTHPVKLLVGGELKAIFMDEKPHDKSAETSPTPTYTSGQFSPPGGIDAHINTTGSSNKSRVKNEKPGVKTAKLSGNAPATPNSSFRIRWR